MAEIENGPIKLSAGPTRPFHQKRGGYFQFSTGDILFWALFNDAINVWWRADGTLVEWWEKNRSARGKTCTTATLLTTNPTWPCLRDDRPVNRILFVMQADRQSPETNQSESQWLCDVEWQNGCDKPKPRGCGMIQCTRWNLQIRSGPKKIDRESSVWSVSGRISFRERCRRGNHQTATFHLISVNGERVRASCGRGPNLGNSVSLIWEHDRTRNWQNK